MKIASNPLSNRLEGSLQFKIATELFRNTIHFPLANILIEMLKVGFFGYVFKVDFYLLIFSCGVQAYFMGLWNYKNKPRPWLGNLIGPAIYGFFEVLLDGAEFFEGFNHQIYIGFSLAIGGVQWLLLRYQRQDLKQGVLLILENLIRTGIIFAMYTTLFVSGFRDLDAFYAFFQLPGNLYLATILPLIGLVLGFADLTSSRYLLILQETSLQLKKYSEWFLGGERLNQALGDQDSLKLRRKIRAVIFMDIRGFTAWSESKSPEEVIFMLNGYFEKAEEAYRGYELIKVKHTADEVLLVLPQEAQAVELAQTLNQTCNEYLRPYGLQAGVGVHAGELVEGLIGSKKVKTFDIIGDTVNTAKRLCDNALGGEILVSTPLQQYLPEHTSGQTKKIQAKGKVLPIEVFVLT